MSFRKSNAYEIDMVSLVCAILLLIIAIFLLIPAIDSNLRDIHVERNYQNGKKYDCLFGRIEKEQNK